MIQKISTIAIGIIQAMQTAQAIYIVVAKAMDSVESTNADKSGGDKKAWVMAYAKNIVLAFWGNKWDELESKVSLFIDQLKSAYNAAKSPFLRAFFWSAHE